MRLLWLWAFCFSLPLFAETTGDRVLQERESRLNALDSSALIEDRQTSALASVKSINGSTAEFIEPNRGLQNLSLLDAVRLSLEKNPDLLLQTSNTGLKKAESYLAQTNQKLFLDFRTGINKAGNIGEESRTPYLRKVFDVSSLEDAYYAGVDLHMPLFDSGISRGRALVLSHESKIKALQGQILRQNLILEVADLFIRLIQIEALLEIRQSELQDARVRSQTLDREQGDERLALEVLSARLTFNQSNQNFLSLMKEKREKEERLRLLLHLDQSKNFSLEKNARTRLLNEPLEGLKIIATRESPELNIIRMQQEIARARYQEINAEQQPTVDLYGKTTYSRIADREVVDEMRYLVGVELDLNLFDSGNNRIKRNMNKVEKDNVQLSLDWQTTQVLAATESFFKEMTDAKNAMENDTKALKLAKSILLEAEDRFSKKQLGLNKLEQARLQYHQAVLGYYEGLGRMIMAKLKLYAKIGRLDLNIFG